MKIMFRIGFATVLVASAGFGSVGVAGGMNRALVGSEMTHGSETRQVLITNRIHRVVVQGTAGGATVTASGSWPVRVTYRSKWAFSKPTIRQYVHAGVLYLESRCRHGRNCGTYFTIRVPARTAVEVHEDAAEVKVYGAPGNVVIDTDFGDVGVHASRAPRRIDVETDAGDVHVSVPRGAYAVDADTDFGREKVRGLVQYDRAARKIRAMTNFGDVTVEGR